MNNATNNNCSMVHVQPGSAAMAHSPLRAATEAVKDTTTFSPALKNLLDALSTYGDSAERMLEEQLETLQDAFLHKLDSTLVKGGVTLSDKLTISLADNQTLIFQCHEDNERLLAALDSSLEGSEELQDMFVALHRLAIMVQGMNFVNRSRSPRPLDAGMPQYKMCLKGALSHFYLK